MEQNVYLTKNMSSIEFKKFAQKWSKIGNTINHHVFSSGAYIFCPNTLMLVGLEMEALNKELGKVTITFRYDKRGFKFGYYDTNNHIKKIPLYKRKCFEKIFDNTWKIL